jgi:Protein of unknown function (DUF4254)
MAMTINGEGFAEFAYSIFEGCINEYHVIDNVDQPLVNQYPEGTIEHLLFEKNWTDNVQWHCEDLVRDSAIAPAYALELKRKIDRLNQTRTDLVEKLDEVFFRKYSGVEVNGDARINTESPAWAIDRLSILALKIYHMYLESSRPDALPGHTAKCRERLNLLLEQKRDLLVSIDQFLEDIESGRRYFKMYKQVKMYNDKELNPVLYANRKD